MSGRTPATKRTTPTLGSLHPVEGERVVAQEKSQRLEPALAREVSEEVVPDLCATYDLVVLTPAAE
nr:hypothetical protein [Deltaproteobacteria bacterium]